MRRTDALSPSETTDVVSGQCKLNACAVSSVAHCCHGSTATDRESRLSFSHIEEFFRDLPVCCAAELSCTCRPCSRIFDYPCPVVGVAELSLDHLSCAAEFEAGYLPLVQRKSLVSVQYTNNTCEAECLKALSLKTR